MKKWKEIKRKKFSEKQCQEIRKRAEERVLENEEKRLPNFPEKEAK